MLSRSVLFVSVFAMVAAFGHNSQSWAHSFYLDARWVSPERLMVDVRVGHAFSGDLLPRMDRHIDVLHAIPESGAGRELVGRDGGLPTGVLEGVQGPQLLLYRSHGVRQTLSRQRFESYAQEEGVDHLLDARAPAGGGFESERFHRCAKSLLGDSESLAARSVDCTIDIVATPRDEKKRRFRVLLRGEPLPFALVRATAEGDRDEILVRSDERGEIEFDLSAGRWMLSAVHLEPAAKTADVDWLSWWSSFVFDVPGSVSNAPNERGVVSR